MRPSVKSVQSVANNLLILFHYRSSDLRRIGGVSPRDHDIVTGPYHARKRARRHARHCGNVDWSDRRSVRRYFPDTKLISLCAAFDPADNGASGRTADNINAPQRFAFINADLFAERG